MNRYYQSHFGDTVIRSGIITRKPCCRRNYRVVRETCTGSLHLILGQRNE